MNRRSFLTTAAAGAITPALVGGRAFGQSWGQASINYDAIGKLRAEALGEKTSQVMKTASYMMDVLGPRLSGSPGIRKSGDWVVSQMKKWGLTGAGLEAWPEDPTGTNNGFPRGWQNSKFYFHAVAPNAFPINGMSIAWTPGTNGLIRGECVLVTETEEKDLKASWSGKLRGKWVLGQAPIEMKAQWDPVAKRYTREQLDGLETPARPPEQGATPGGPQPPRPPQPANNNRTPPYNRNEFFRSEGALGILSTNKGHGVVNILGGSRTDAPDRQIPRIAVEAEHYGRIARSVQQGQNVTIEADIRNDWFDKPEMFNVVGEIRGSERPEEIVIIGGHFDSFHSATGATDNGGACSIALEAMRILKATKTPLKRTVRVCLWNGEEQGLIGSRLYVADHFGGVRGVPTRANARGELVPVKRDHGRFQGYFNLDNGAGSIRGIHAQGNGAITPIFRQWIEPFRDLGMTHVSSRRTGSTDHVSFDNAGLPGFQFIQDTLEYEPKTHHTNMDFYEALQPEDMKRNSAILAGFAMLAANHPTMLPRQPRPSEPPPIGQPQQGAPPTRPAAP
ncbi:MAG: M20/M25/M40 family metallo-hydrolase [Hyphomonadaceae bacterium]|nr:M20/M25/M40 family metallo-hydrolase [Hyphomonadaceae bacterium]